VAANPSMKKREKERARQQRQRDKEEKRHARKVDRALHPEGAGADGTDPAAPEVAPGAPLE
jgi:hypothetical protein